MQSPATEVKKRVQNLVKLEVSLTKYKNQDFYLVDVTVFGGNIISFGFLQSVKGQNSTINYIFNTIYQARDQMKSAVGFDLVLAGLPPDTYLGYDLLREEFYLAYVANYNVVRFVRIGPSQSDVFLNKIHQLNMDIQTGKI